jgi:hypothetical protein
MVLWSVPWVSLQTSGSDTGTDNDAISEEGITLLKNPLLWSVLYHANKPRFVELDECGGFGVEGFGFGQPNVRKGGWGLLMKLLENHQGTFIIPYTEEPEDSFETRAYINSHTGPQFCSFEICLG